MIDKNEVRGLRQRLRAYDRPLLSLYVDMYPSAGENVARAVHTRVKNTLSDLDGLPSSISQRVIGHFVSRPPNGRAVVLFADEQHTELMELQANFLDDSHRDHVAAHWGAPYFTPLLRGMDEHQPYAVLVTEGGSVRLFEVAMGEIEELLSEPAVRMVETPNALNQKNQDGGEVPEYLSLKEQGRRIEQIVQSRGIERLLLMGPVRSAREVLSWLPSALSELVVAVLPDVPQTPAPAREVLRLVSAKIHEVERQNELDLLTLIQERGIVGIDACLRALQEGRLHTVAYPEKLHQDVFCDTETNYVSTSEDGALPGRGRVVRVDLAKKLPSLVASWGARLEFVGGDGKSTLIDKLGGMGGLARW